MGIPRFFKLARPRQFDHIPIYYDPEKEKREERERRIRQELGMKVEGERKATSISRGSFRQYGSKYRQRASAQSNRRLIIIFVFLTLLAYLLFYR